jgi:hypothetical protein
MKEIYFSVKIRDVTICNDAIPDVVQDFYSTIFEVASTSGLSKEQLINLLSISYSQFVMNLLTSHQLFEFHFLHHFYVNLSATILFTSEIYYLFPRSYYHSPKSIYDSLLFPLSNQEFKAI